MEPVIVWWASPRDVRAEHENLLDPVERARRERYLRPADRDRFTVGVALTRLALAPLLGMPAARVPITRTCADCGEPHGKPVVAGGPHLSVSHSGDRIAVAISGHGEVGVDVEQLRPVEESITRLLLTADETTELHRLPPDDRTAGLLTYWTRKEAVVKATGDGLRAALTALAVSAPAKPPALLAWEGRDGQAQRFTLRPLDPGPGHVACLALIDQPDVPVLERQAGGLLELRTA